MHLVFKELKSPIIPGLPDYDNLDKKGVPVDKAGTLIIWEAFLSKMCRQISMIQFQSSTFLDSHRTVRQVIEKGDFKDGAHLGEDPAYVSAAMADLPDTSGDASVTETVPVSIVSMPATMGRCAGGLVTELEPCKQVTLTPVYEEEGIKEPHHTPMMIKHYSNMETLDIVLPPDGSRCVTVSCPKPAQLSVLLSELLLETNAGLAKNSHVVMYYYPHNASAVVELRSQEDLDVFLMFKSTPTLFAKPAL